MRRIATGLLVALAMFWGAAVSTAHDVTYEGTVVALQLARYAQPEGGFREVPELEVNVIDARTRRSMNMVFTITDETRLFRDGQRVSVADADVQEAEPVAVVVDHDKAGDEAIEIRLQARE